jgi:malate/lactate dehydrogenase
MELQDGAYPLLEKIIVTDEPEIALQDCDVAIFTGGFPRRPGMERKDLISANSQIFVAQGQALNRVASKNVKCLVVANPANTNCWILRQHAPSLPDSAFTCLTRLDYNRARFQIASKIGCSVNAISNVTIWGNHSATQVHFLTSPLSLPYSLCLSHFASLPCRFPMLSRAPAYSAWTESKLKR